MPKLKTITKPARDWTQLLAQYREPDQRRSIWELFATLVPLVGLWLLAWAALSISAWLTLAIAVPASGFLVRLFMIQHDCGHGAFFCRRATNDWVGRIIGVLTLTPYDVWRRSRAIHHATTGNLDQRGIGDIATLTVREYQARPWWRRMLYRIYRNPLVMFGIGPAYLFIVQNRLPLGFMRAGWRFWVSSTATNVAIAVMIGLLIYLVGLGPFLIVHLPIMLLASSIGVWLFYIQHQFEDTVWAAGPEWNFHDAALHGSSHYDLPAVLRWFTANIGMHHVHHLCSRIPYYRLPSVLRDHPELADVTRLTLVQSLASVRLRLWDETHQKLVSFREARKSAALADRRNH
ncbi:MAG: fatty acid desaturase [Hyphomicrobiaceae bacterium]